VLLATLWFDVGGPSELIAKLAAVLFFGIGLIGVLRFMYAFLFLKTEDSSQPQPSQLSVESTQALPPAQSNPAQNFQRSGSTREMVAPSVTENTTRLLDETEQN